MELGQTFRATQKLPALERQYAQDARRSQRINDLKPRLLHAKTRLIGIDVDALDSQVEAKQERLRHERERDLHYEKMTTENARMISTLDAKKRVNMRAAEEQLAAFRKEQALEKKRRDREDALRAMGAAGEGGAQGRDDTAVFIKFPGEDRDKDVRDKMQARQLQDWLTEQVVERQQDRAAAAAEEQVRFDQTRRINSLADDAEEQAKAARRKASEEVARYNKEMAARKVAKQRFTAEKSLRQATTELDQALQSQFLNEDPATTMSLHPATVSQPTRRVPYHFKGFSVQERQSIVDQQRQQQLELRNRRIKEQQDEMDYARQQEDLRREMIRQDRERARVQATNLKTLQYVHRAQKQEQDARTDYINKNVYVNPVDAAFFDKFGTSAR